MCPTVRRGTDETNTRSCCFLYKTGARVSEATQLRVRDLQIGRRDGGHALVTLHGKGGKVRQCPLRPEIERVLVELVEGRAAVDAVFLNRRQQPFTRFGVYWVVERCAAQVPALVGRKITPHVLRHTTACHLVFAGERMAVWRRRLLRSTIWAFSNCSMASAAEIVPPSASERIPSTASSAPGILRSASIARSRSRRAGALVGAQMRYAVHDRDGWCCFAH